MPFAHVIRSGSRPNRPLANHAPPRPNPVITSSATKSTPVSRQTWRARGEVAVGRREDAAGADHRLAEERRDAVGAERSIVVRSASASSQATSATSGSKPP